MDASMNKTNLMREAEALAGKPLEQALPELLNTIGWDATIQRLEAPRATMHYWLMKLGITKHVVYVPPGYRLVLIPKEAPTRRVNLSEDT